MSIKKLSCFFLVFIFVIISSCKLTSRGADSTGDSVGIGDSKYTTKDITAFSVAGIAGTITGTNIAITVPPCTDLTSLVPTIAHTGSNVIPASGTANDFTSVVVYTVTADDSSTKDYTITVVEQAYALRDVGPAGGLIFYDQGNCTGGWRYLESAPSDQSAAQAWTNTAVASTSIGTTSLAIGTGKTNTAKIIAQAGHITSAAKLCNDLVVGDYTDWFLPSKDELNQMYAELKVNGVGGFAASDYYWSSSEYASNAAWAQFTGSFYQTAFNKPYPTYVRCARAF